MTLIYHGVEGIGASVEYDRHDGDREQYKWRLFDTSTGETLAEGCDLRSGSDGATDSEMLRTFFGFLGAWAESVEYEERTGSEGENAHLFPRSLLDATDAGTWEEFANDATISVFPCE